MRSLLMLLTVPLLALLPLARDAHAAPSALLSGPLPQTMFPAGSARTVERNADAVGYTCAWGLDCLARLPGEHSVTADGLGRTGGWLQTEVWSATIASTHGKKAHTATVMEGYDFAVSSFIDAPTPSPDMFGSMPAAAASFVDFTERQAQMGMHEVANPPAFARSPVAVWLEKDQKPYVELAGGFWTGTDDVEAVAVCQHCTAFQVHDLKTLFAAALSALRARA